MFIIKIFKYLITFIIVIALIIGNVLVFKKNLSLNSKTKSLKQDLAQYETLLKEIEAYETLDESSSNVLQNYQTTVSENEKLKSEKNKLEEEINALTQEIAKYS